MVLAEKNENAGPQPRNGRRSRGPSPQNGHQVPQEEESDEDSSVPVDKIRVGRDYQAICPELQPEAQRKPELLADRALLVWSPTDNIPDSKLEEYIILAKDKYGYNGEQALGMLFWHKHDLDRAVLDLANFTPFPDEWSVEDKVLFEQAFQFHGKSFHRIKQMLPDKPIASLVKYYYSWKKTRSKTSFLDKQARKLNNPKEDGNEEGGSEGGSHDEENDEKVGDGVQVPGFAKRKFYSEENTIRFQQGEGGTCSNCGVYCSVTHVTPKGTLCNSCYQHWRRTGTARPTSGPTGGKRGALPAGALRHQRRKPPRGIYINHDDLATMASPGNAGTLMLRAMDRELESLQRQIQQNKQSISSLKRKHSDSIEDLRPPNDNSQRINTRWTTDDSMLAVQAFRKYGKDFKSVGEMLNRSESYIRTFYVNYRKKMNLDQVIKEWEKNNGPSPDGDVNGDMKIDDDDVICISPEMPTSNTKSLKNGGKMSAPMIPK